MRTARILYVPQGFDTIDQGIIAALRTQVSEVHITDSHTMRQRAEELKPDLVLVLNGLHYFPTDHGEQIAAIREMGIKTAIWFVDDPYFTDWSVNIALHYDLVVTQEKSCEGLYREAGCANVHYLQMAAHTSLFQPMSVPEQYRTDVCFIGIAFYNRAQLFDEIAHDLKRHKLFIGGDHWSRMREYRHIRHSVRPGYIVPIEAAKYYNGAKIVINVHRAPDPGPDNHNRLGLPAHSLNPRTFDLAACGALQLVDDRQELLGSYTVGKEIVAYRNARELVELIDYYLTHEEERLEIAARGYRRTIRDHTFDNRMTQLLEWALL